MTKKDIVDKIILEFPYISREQAKLIVELILDKIAATIKSGKRAEFRGFGTFKQRVRSPYRTKAMSTNDIVLIRRRVLPAFKASTYLNDVINGRIELKPDSFIMKEEN